MHSVEDLFDELWKTPIGRSFVCNFLDGVRWNIIEHNDAKTFVDQWKFVLGSGSFVPMEIIDDIASSSRLTLKSGVAPTDFPIAVTTTFSCKHLPAILRGSPTTGTRRLADLVEQYQHAATYGERYSIQDEIYVEIDVRSGGAKDGLIELKLSSSIAGPMPFAWFTSYGEGDIEAEGWRSRSDWSQRADRTRDVLGLVHRGSTQTPPFEKKPELLGAFVVKRGSVPLGTNYCRPNCLDAGFHSRFKCGFGNLTKKAYEWGRALNLERMIECRPHRGGREIVISNFIPTHSIWFTVLGEVLVPRSDFLGMYDDVYEKSVRRERNKGSLKRRFCRVIR